MTWNIFHKLTCYLHIFFGEIFVNVFDPFFNLSCLCNYLLVGWLVGLVGGIRKVLPKNCH